MHVQFMVISTQRRDNRYWFRLETVSALYRIESDDDGVSVDYVYGGRFPLDAGLMLRLIVNADKQATFSYGGERYTAEMIGVLHPFAIEATCFFDFDDPVELLTGDTSLVLYEDKFGQLLERPGRLPAPQGS